MTQIAEDEKGVRPATGAGLVAGAGAVVGAEPEPELGVEFEPEPGAELVVEFEPGVAGVVAELAEVIAEVEGRRSAEVAAAVESAEGQLEIAVDQDTE